jgi:hypothetical protein
MANRLIFGVLGEFISVLLDVGSILNVLWDPKDHHIRPFMRILSVPIRNEDGIDPGNRKG